MNQRTPINLSIEQTELSLKNRKYLAQNAAAVDIHLSNADIIHIEDIIKKYPNTGERYNEESLKMVNL